MSVYGAGKHVWVTDWLPLVRDRLLAAVSGMTADRVFVSAWAAEDHLKFPPDDRFITLFVGDFPVDQRNVDGGGSVNTAFDSTLAVTAFARVEADIENWSPQQLMETSIGLYPFLQQILAALQTWPGPDPVADPDAPDAEMLLPFRRPVRIRPGFTVRPKTGGDGKRWAVAEMKFECSFVSALGPTYLFPYPVTE